MQWCLGLSSLNTLGSLPSLRHSVVAGSTVDPLLDTLNRCVECSCGQDWEWDAAASEIVVHLTENPKIYTTTSTWACSFSVMALSVFRSVFSCILEILKWSSRPHSWWTLTRCILTATIRSLNHQECPVTSICSVCLLYLLPLASPYPENH